MDAEFEIGVPVGVCTSRALVLQRQGEDCPFQGNLQRGRGSKMF